MGLTDCGAAFQKRVELTRAGLDGVDVYIDDILIGGKTRMEHDERLRKTLSRLEADDFRLKKEKLIIPQQKAGKILNRLVPF